jgi:diaminopimelate decarboxylase
MNNSMYTSSDDELVWQGFKLSDLARKYGTPLWVYSADQIRHNYNTIKEAFGSQVEIRYAVKANDSLRVLSILDQCGSGFDVVSGGELYKVRKINVDTRRISFAGAAKTDSEIAEAIRQQIGMINVESLDELEVINTSSRGLSPNKVPKLSLRIAPGIDPHTDHHISTGHIGTKFGMEMSMVIEILDDYSMGNDFQFTSIEGIHVHVGSQIHDPAVYVAAIDVVLPLFEKYDFLKTLDLGGGFPVSYGGSNEEAVLPIETFAKAINDRLAQANLPADFKLLIEPGRSIVADAGLLIVQVQSTKMSGDTRIITCDGGMADLVRPAMYDSYHEIKPMCYDAENHKILDFADVAGPHCESSDFLGKHRLLPLVSRGDYLAILTAGAYGRTMSSNYNCSRFAPEVFIDNGNVDIYRMREQYEDQIFHENF